jgi:hypothetical protein
VAKGGELTLAKALGEPGGGYAVVCCDLSPKAVQSQAFEHLLAVNGIALEWSAGRENVSTDTQIDATGEAPDRRGQEQVEEQREVTGVRLAAIPPVELDLVYVEATREQLQATLDAIDAQPGEFLSYSVEPAPGVEVQKDWGRQYRRGVEEKIRRSGGMLAGKAEDSADTEAVVRAKAPALERQAAEGEAKDQSQAPAQGPSPQGTLRVPLPEGTAKGAFEAGTLLAGETQKGGLGTGTQQSLGRAWRLQIPGPVIRGRLSPPAEAALATQSGATVQQAGPGGAAPDGPVVAEVVRAKPPGAPVAEPKPEVPVPTEKEGKSAIPGSQPTRNLVQTPSLPTPLTTSGAKGEGPPRGGDTPPAPAKPAAEPPAPAEQPAKSPDAAPRQDESLKAGSSGQAAGKVGVQGGAPKPKKGMTLGAPGAPQAKAPPTQLADKSLQGNQPAEPNVSPRLPLDQAEEKANEKSVSQQQRQRQDFKQQPPVQTYRVLFVLRMIRPDVAGPSAAAALMTEQAKPAAAPAPESTPPAAKQ